LLSSAFALAAPIKIAQTEWAVGGSFMQKFAIMVAVLLGLVACREEGVAVAPMPMDQSCGADGLQSLLGQDKSVLAGMRFSQPLRVISPGMAVTMDYSPARLNIDLDGAGQIIRVHCG
jgi:hypothetical protein